MKTVGQLSHSRVLVEATAPLGLKTGIWPMGRVSPVIGSVTVTMGLMKPTRPSPWVGWCIGMSMSSWPSQ